jgi:hypothetical protein
MNTGIELIALERAEQINKHNRTVEGDVMNNNERQLKMAATALLANNESWFPTDWGTKARKKMFDKSYKERLVIAGALIAAELDRINNTSN